MKITFTYLLIILLPILLNSQVLQMDDVKLTPVFPRDPVVFKHSKISSLEDLCDIETQTGLCVNNGSRIYLKNAKIKDLVCHISFDDSLGLDHSGYGNHANIMVSAAPSFGEKGTSGYFDGNTYMQIENNQAFSTKTYSVTFWLFLIPETKQESESKVVKPLRWCPIILKGNDDHEKERYERSPGIFLDRKDRNIRVATSTSDRINNPQGETLLSVARIPHERWTQISIVRKEKKTIIYINGIKDSEKPTEGYTSPNSHPLYLGKAPWHNEECQVQFYMDEFKYYTRELEEYEIQAEASSSLGGIEPNYYKLACQNCDLNKAKTTCQTLSYRLCRSIELQSGGLQVAKSMGWVDENSNIWAESSKSKDDTGENQNMGVGICCQNKQ